MISNRENDSVQNSHLVKDSHNKQMEFLEKTVSEESKKIFHTKPFYQMKGKNER